jgi:diadenosine tetraphosphate (Ap4A) HIT family hydrolase
VPPNPDCIFCKIIAGRAEATFLFRETKVAAFLDVFPWMPGHTLVVPRRHVTGLAELTPELGGHMLAAGRRVAAALRRGIPGCEGVNFFLADGAVAGQTVFHCHLHVLPRAAADGFGIRRAAVRPPSREELEAQATRLRTALPAPRRTVARR